MIEEKKKTKKVDSRVEILRVTPKILQSGCANSNQNSRGGASAAAICVGLLIGGHLDQRNI